MERLFLSPPHMSGRELEYVRAAFESNYIAPLGPMVDGFERDFCERFQHGHALALSSGTAAMHLAMIQLGVTRGSLVLGSSLTFIGSISSAVHLDAEMAFIDSEPNSWNMDPDLLAQALDDCKRAGRRVAAVVPTDIYGQPADMDRIVDICERHEVPVIEDAAEALGASYQGRPVGGRAKAVVYSFNGNKIITTSGGGMLVSEDQELIERARFLSTQARDPLPHYEHTVIGYNYRMSNVVAAIGRGQLEVLDERVDTRRAIFERYVEGLRDIPGISFMPEAAWARHTRWLSVIVIDSALAGFDRETARLHLEKVNIESRPVWKPMHLQPLFKGCAVWGGSFSEAVFRDGLCLPSGSSMSRERQDETIERIRHLALTNS